MKIFIECCIENKGDTYFFSGKKDLKSYVPKVKNNNNKKQLTTILRLALFIIYNLHPDD